LQNKHNVKTISELIEIKNQLSDKLNNIISFEKELFDLKSKIEVKKKYLDDKSDILSANRVSAIPHIEKQLKQFLTKLGIPGAEIKIITTTNTEFNNSGKDEVVYYFNANKGNDSREISKVASGGELSRIMLAVKALLSEKNQLPTIVFDEIDIGVSGEIALKTASIIHKMSERMQVIVISHLPQIVAKGDIHYLVYKDINDNITHSKIRKLNKEERIEEIAKIIGGDKITSATIETAKELLKQ
ncbi:MAG: DNA repair protein RecN, partial [Bacteroidales bacterium]|nr:DNA repair protein RecN [Bacteroidales bacterium]